MSEKNPLIGSWERDNERTASELTLKNPKFHKEYELVKRVIRCEEEKRCARTIAEHTEKESITNLFDSNGIRVSRESTPYKLTTTKEGYQFMLDGYEMALVSLDDNILRFELNYRGFTWKEYWHRYSGTTEFISPLP